MTTDPYRMTVEQLEEQSRVAQTAHITSVGDGMGPPPVGTVAPPHGDADSDGE